MTRYLLLPILLAAPALTQTPVSSGGTRVIGGPSSSGSVSLPASAPFLATHADGSVYSVTSIPFSMLAGFPTVDPSAGGMAATLGASVCTTAGCQIQIPASFPYDGYRTAYGTFTGLAQSVTDLRGGAHQMTVNDPLPTDQFKLPQGYGFSCYFGAAQPVYLDGGQGANCMQIVSHSSSPGWNNAYVGGLTQGWLNQQGFGLDLLGQGQGLVGGFGMTVYHAGVGDIHMIYNYGQTNGGAITDADEGAQGFAQHMDEGANFYAGVIDSASGETIQTHPTSGGYAELGIGQRIVDLSNPVATGTVVSSVDGNDGVINYETFQIAGATVTPSKYWGTLDAAINTVPSINPAGNNNIYTTVTFGFTKTGGAGAPAVGDYLNFTVKKPETVRITAVTSPSTGHYQITAKLRQTVHPAGMTVYEWTYGRGGLELQGNTMGLGAYDLDTIGATDSTHVVSVQNTQGHTRSPWSSGNVDLRSYALDAIGNTGGVVTVSLYIAYPDNKFYGFPAGIVIANSAVTAFNGVCANVRNFIPPPPQGGKSTFNCDQTSSNGLFAAYNQGQTMTFNTNNAFTLRRMAEVVDINTYATGKSPIVAGLLRLEPNTISTATGTAIAMHHHPSMAIDAIDSYSSVDNPYFVGRQLHIAADGHAIGANYTFAQIENGESPYSYAGFGGSLSAPHAIVLTGVFSNFLEWGNAPTPGGSLLNTGCPPDPIGCGGTGSQGYSYGLFSFQGRTSNASLFFAPYTSALTLNASSFTMPQFAQLPVPFAYIPACGSASAPEGTWRTVTDASTAVYNATAAGGGSNHTPLYCNGTNWVAR